MRFGRLTDPQFVVAIQDLAAECIGQLTPEQNAVLGAVTAASAIPSEFDTRLADNGFDLPRGYPDRRALGLALLETTVQGLEGVRARDAGPAIDAPARPPVMAPAPQPASSDKPLLSAMRERWRKDLRPKDKKDDHNALYVEYFIGAFGNLPVDRITKPLLTEFMDLLQRCPRNVPHAIRYASLKDRVAWGEKPANLRKPRLARRPDPATRPSPTNRPRNRYCWRMGESEGARCGFPMRRRVRRRWGACHVAASRLGPVRPGRHGGCGARRLPARDRVPPAP